MPKLCNILTMDDFRVKTMKIWNSWSWDFSCYVKFFEFNVGHIKVYGNYANRGKGVQAIASLAIYQIKSNVTAV